MPYQTADHHRRSERFLDMIPGGLAWSGLVLVVLGAFFVPGLVIWLVALLALYSAVRFTFAGLATVRGLRLIRQWENTAWLCEYTRRATSSSLLLNTVHHVVIIPNYREDISILRRTLDGLAAQPASMTVVLAMEASEPGAQDKAALLQTDYEGRFERILITLHPQGLAGEMQCKSANLAWAARQAKRILVDEMGYNMDHLIVTVMDADTLWHLRYFESLTVLFATEPQRYSTFWQAPIRYHGNIWTINPLMRILHAYSSSWELAYLAAPWWRALPMSSYSMSLRLLEQVGYWDTDVIADEWHMFLKAYFGREGQVCLSPVFLPFYAYATLGIGVWDAVKERYLQTLRHAWGAKEIGYTIMLNREHPQIAFSQRFGLLLRVAHDNVLAGAGWIVMMLGAQFPLLFHPAFVQANLDTLPFILLQGSLVLITLLSIAFWALDLRLRPARSASWTWRERWYEFASLPLLAILTLVCVALPVLDAQTRLLVGKPLQFRVSAKGFGESEQVDTFG